MILHPTESLEMKDINNNLRSNKFVEKNCK